VSLVVQNLSVRKGGKPILEDISFTAPQGKVTGLVGPNGAGKSTLLAAMIGLTPATGIALFSDNDLPHMGRRDRARMTAFVEQSVSTEERLTVREVVALGRIPFEAPWQAEPTAEDNAIIDAALAESGMSSFGARRFSTLSGGEQQRVQLARALAQQPQLLLLDEPTSHLDIRAQLQLLALLRRKAHGGTTIVLALHDLNHALRFCDHLVVLGSGKVAAEGPPAAILTPALLLGIYGVHARVLAANELARPTIVFDEAAPANPD
jgi:iron complex transport system ATP-binding protein